ncbi:MAG TPA: nitroreductase [Pilimelia sp.]|nr:nitroreductase [Pilimelia sp.]
MIPGWWVSVHGEPGPTLAGCLEAAVAAPSVHNTQPWLFRLRDGAIDVLADRTRQLTVLDPDGRELTMSVGAAVFNLRVAVLSHGRIPLLRLLPAPDEPDLLGRIVPGRRAPRSATARRLDRAIPLRHTNRRPFYDIPIPREVLDDLAAAAHAEHADLTVLGPAVRDDIFGLVRTAEGRRRLDPSYWTELSLWTRDIPGRRDGVPPAAFGPWPVLDSVPLRDFGLVQPARRRHAERFEHEPTVVVLQTSGDGPRDWLHAGQALERVLLTATVRGVASTLMTQPLELPELRALVRDRVGGGIVQALVRLGYGPPSPPSPRRPLTGVLLAG